MIYVILPFQKVKLYTVHSSSRFPLSGNSDLFILRFPKVKLYTVFSSSFYSSFLFPLSGNSDFMLFSVFRKYNYTQYSRVPFFPPRGPLIKRINYKPKWWENMEGEQNTSPPLQYLNCFDIFQTFFFYFVLSSGRGGFFFLSRDCTVQCTVQYSVQYSTVQCTVQYIVDL